MSSLSNIPESAQSAYADLMDREDEASEMDSRGMAWCDQCESYVSRVRTVKINGEMVDRCRECKPFDRPCEACGNAEAMEGCDGCLACEIEGDLHDVQREIARMMWALLIG